MRQFEMGFEPLKLELRTKNAQLERERAHLEAAVQRQAQVERNLKDLDDSILTYQAELSQDFKKALSAGEERQLEEFSAEVHRLQRELKEISKKRFELEGRKKLLETELQSHLRPQEDQLRSQAFENSTTGGSENFKDAQRELKKAQRAMVEVEQQLQENEQKAEKLGRELTKLEAQKSQKEEELQELQKRIDHHQKRMEKNIQTRARLVSQAAEYAKNIRDLGILPEEAFGKYEKMKPEQVSCFRERDRQGRNPPPNTN
jgi:structural maintenance of chromosome 3 (chondroitin sulfate proteoglycan 6)